MTVVGHELAVVGIDVALIITNLDVNIAMFLFLCHILKSAEIQSNPSEENFGVRVKM